MFLWSFMVSGFTSWGESFVRRECDFLVFRLKLLWDTVGVELRQDCRGGFKRGPFFGLIESVGRGVDVCLHYVGV